MNVAVRYYSQLGNTKKLAEQIADELGTKAVSITDEPHLTNPVDILFLGGAPYANVMAPELEAYAKELRPSQVGKVALFSTSNWSRRTILGLRKILKAAGVPVATSHFWAHMTQVAKGDSAARSFAAAQLNEAVTEGPDRGASLAEAFASAVIIGAALAGTVVVWRKVWHRRRYGG